MILSHIQQQIHIFTGKGVFLFSAQYFFQHFSFSVTELKCKPYPFWKVFPIIMRGLMFRPRSCCNSRLFPLSLSPSVCTHRLSFCVAPFFSLTRTQGTTRSCSFTASHQSEGVTGTNVCSLDDTAAQSWHSGETVEVLQRNWSQNCCVWVCDFERV